MLCACAGQGLADRRQAHPAARRLQPEQAAQRRRDTDRAAAVGGMGHRQAARRHDGRGAARRSAGREVGTPRVYGRTAECGLRRRRQSQFAGVGAADDHQAGTPQARDRGAVVRGHRFLGEESRPQGRRRTGTIGHQLLDDIGHALERPLARRRDRFLQERAFIEIGDGVQRSIEGAKLVQRAVQKVARAELACLDQLGDGERIQRREEILHRLSSANARG